MMRTQTRRQRPQSSRGGNGSGYPPFIPAPDPVIDPTKNVLQLVEAANKRQDDLRDMERRHSQQIAELRWRYDTELRRAETERINAIRAVDVSAVQRAAEVQAVQATTLASQVATVAETLRTQVQAAAAAQSTALANALMPLSEAIADLRRAQYEAQGVKSHGGETRLNIGAILGGFATLIALAAFVATLIR